MNEARTIIERGRTVRALIEAQNAAQWLAHLSVSFGQQQNDAEVQLFWDDTTRHIVTPEIAPGTIVGLSLPALTLQFEERGKPSPHPIDLEDKSPAQIEAWLLAELLHRGFDRDRFSKDLPYEWPHVMAGDETKYSPRSLFAELDQLTRWFEDATKVLAELRRCGASNLANGVAVAGRSKLSCSPEQFTIFFIAPSGCNSKGGSTKIGFSVEDETHNQPRYFVTRGSGKLESAELTLDDIARQAMSQTAIVADLAEKVQKMHAAETY